MFIKIENKYFRTESIDYVRVDERGREIVVDIAIKGVLYYIDSFPNKKAAEKFVDFLFIKMKENVTLCTDTKSDDELPAADAAPTATGQWIERDGEYGFKHYCSNCGKAAVYDCLEDELLSRYCYRCGAYMLDGE